jgi:hypothetical protein
LLPVGHGRGEVHTGAVGTPGRAARASDRVGHAGTRRQPNEPRSANGSFDVDDETRCGTAVPGRPHRGDANRRHRERDLPGARMEVPNADDDEREHQRSDCDEAARRHRDR